MINGRSGFIREICVAEPMTGCRGTGFSRNAISLPIEMHESTDLFPAKAGPTKPVPRRSEKVMPIKTSA